MNVIKRTRKKKFTTKRRPYKSYLEADWNWIDIFSEIDLLKSEKASKVFILISEKYGIVYSTLRNKYSSYKNNKIVVDNKEHRGGSNKIFNIDEQKTIFDTLKENFIDKNEMLCDQMIKIQAKSYYVETYPNQIIPKFSSGWCYIFKNCWNLSTVRCTISRKATTVYTNDELNNFLSGCKKEHKRVGSDKFFNMDEMKCNNINVSSTTIHIKGTDNAKIKVNGNEKEGVTTALTVAASGKKLMPLIIGKGKTERCLKKYKIDKNKIIGSYSNNGWMNNGIMKKIIDMINKETNNKNSCLLLDQHRSHTSAFIKEYAKKKKIKLLYVPKGYTYKFQPLDVGINCIIKAKSKATWRTEKIKDPNLKITNEDAVKHFLKAYEEITPANIKKSFEKSCFGALQ